MATYNGAKYIREQIESIQNQTISDFELVVCDDCSSDDTVYILNQYAQKDDRVHVYENEHNLGFKKNFELAISKTSGDFVALCDQDDIWQPDHLELLLAEMKDSVQVVCGRPIFINENYQKLPLQDDYLLMYCPPTSNEDTARHIILGRNTYQGASMLIRKSFIERALPVTDGANYHDCWFAILACFMDGFVYVDKPTMKYRRFFDSVTSGEKRISAVKRFCASIVYNYTAKDRLALIEGVRSRVKEMTKTQVSFLDGMEKRVRRDRTLWGRLLNVPYKLCHFKAIYACDFKHFFCI